MNRISPTAEVVRRWAECAWPADLALTVRDFVTAETQRRGD